MVVADDETMKRARMMRLKKGEVNWTLKKS